MKDEVRNAEYQTLRTSSSTPSWPWWLLTAYLLFLILSLLVVVWVSVRADEAGEMCLAGFAPLIQWIVESGRWLSRDPIHKGSILGWVLFAVISLPAAGGLITRKREGIRPALILAAGGLAVLGQTSLFTDLVWRGCALYGLAIVMIVLWRFLPRSLGPGLGDSRDSANDSDTRDNFSQKRTTFLVLEALCLALITTGTILYYFYALNQLPADFEGEMSSYMAISTSIDGLLKVNYTVPGQHPLGLFYFLFLYAAERTCGTTLLAVRFVSAVVGVLLVNLFYGFLRRIGGVSVAIVGATLLAVNSVSITWGRQDFFPFSYPTLVVLALCWTTYLAVEMEKYRYFLLTALLMGATYHVFPSGQTGFLIPVGVATWHLLVTRGFARRCWWKMSAVALGVALWVMGLPISCYLATGTWRWLNPLALNRGKTLWSLPTGEADLFERVGFLAQEVWQNILGFTECLFIGNIWPVHQTIFYGIPGRPTTYISAAVAVLLVLGVVALVLSPRRKVSILLLCWIVVASLPGILSTQASARRLTTIFPALFAVAALTAAGGFNTIHFLFGRHIGAACRVIGTGTMVAVLFLLHGTFYFRQSPHSPPSVNMARAMRPYLKPGTLVVTDIQLTYYTSSELTYMMLDELNRGDDPAVYYLAKPSDWPALAIWPQPDFNPWYYKYTFLEKRVPALKSRTEWNGITYLIQDVPENQRKIEILKELYPGASVAEEHHTPEHPWYDFIALETNAEATKLLRKPVAMAIGEPERLPDDPQGWWDPVEVRFLTATSTAVPEAPKVTLSAGLWVKEQSWESFRVVNGGKPADLRLDGRPLETDQMIPLTGGFHRIDIGLRPPWDFPLKLRSRTDEKKDYQTVPSERLAAPGVSEVAGLAAQGFVPYSGFHPPERVATVQKGFEADFAISPSGKTAMVGVFASDWRVQVFQSNGTKTAEWGHPIPVDVARRGCLIAFAGEERIVVVDWRWPMLLVYNLAGEIVTEIEVPPSVDVAYDIAANQEGEIFIASAANHCVLHLSLEGEELGRLTPPGHAGSQQWRPYQVSVPLRGPVAVGDYIGEIHVFEADGASPKRRRWAKVIPPQSEGGGPLFQIRQDGWIFMRYWDQVEFRVLDDQGRRRIAEQPAHDLSKLLINKCRQILGFDREENLYVWHEAGHEILRLAPRQP